MSLLSGLFESIGLVFKRRLVVSFHEESHEYDGTGHRPACQASGLAEGHRLEIRTACPPVDVTNGFVEVPVLGLRVISKSGRDVTRRYAAKVGSPRVRIVPRRLTLRSTSGSMVWDGEHALTREEVIVQGLVEGETLSARGVGRAVEVGSTENSIAIDWASSTARAENYEVVLMPGTLEITERPLVAVGKNLRVVYDGKPHCLEVEAPQGAEVEFDGPHQFVSVGHHAARFVARMSGARSASGSASIDIFDSPQPIVVRTVGGEITYDGEIHRAEVERPILPEGYSLVEAHSTAQVRDVDDGTVVATCDVLRITNAEGEDVTSRLNVVFESAELRIVPRKLFINTFDAHREYNGGPLRASGSVRFLVSGETVTFETTGSQTEIGECVNTYELRFDGTARQCNYSVAESLGTLRVLKPSSEQGQSVPIEEGRSTDEKDVSSKEETKSKAAVPAVSSNPASDNAVPWRAPKVRPLSVTGGGSRRAGRVREFQARPIDRRPDLEAEGLGRGFKPYDLESRPLGDRSLETELLKYNNRAYASIDALLAQRSDGLLYECFGSFSTEFEEIRAAFAKLFGYFSYDQRYALVWIDEHCRAAFMLYVAIQANELYDGSDLWGNLFDSIGLKGQGMRAKFCKMFVAYLYQRHMFVFEPQRRHMYMLDTALLHGGFSETVWNDLWSHALLPLARSAHAPGPDAPGAQIHEWMIDQNSGFAPHSARVVDLLRHASRESVATLCSMAWRVATQVTGGSRIGGASTLLSSHGLPDAAMRSLQTILNVSAVSSQAGAKPYIFLHDVSLILDRSRGAVKFVWEKERMPRTLRGARIDLYLNGEKVHSVELGVTADSVVLPGGSFDVAPHARYDIERRIVVDQPESGRSREVASLVQSFQNSKPGCFEFVRDARGVYRFRNAGERLIRESVIAYLVEGGLRVEGCHGMELIDRVSWAGSQADMTVFEYKVTPGAAGRICDEASGDIVTAWREDFSVRIEKSGVIGTAGGLDLYGHVLGVGETDVALPLIQIDALAEYATNDIEVRFSRDGRSAPLNSEIIGDASGGMAMLSLSFPTSELARGIGRYCVVEARQRSTRDILLRYRFAIAPIQGFRLEDYKINSATGELIGIYQFEVTEPLSITYSDDDGFEELLETGVQSNLERPLQDDAARVELRDGSGTMLEAELFLAGVKVSVSSALLERKRAVPYIGLPTARVLSYIDGDVSVVTRSPRRGRHVMVRLGGEILIDKRLERAGGTKVNLFERQELLKPLDDRVYAPMSLVISIAYGFRLKGDVYEPAVANYRYLQCGHGLEFEDCGISLIEGKYRFQLKGGQGITVPSCPLRVTFLSSLGEEYGSACMSVGERSVALPEAAVRSYSERRRIRIRVEMSKGLFGGWDDGNALEIVFQRGGRSVVKKPYERGRR